MRGSDLLIVLGVLAVLAGVAARLGLLSWFGNLPGDLRFGGERSTGFIPITSMLIVSLALTVVVNLLARLFRS